MLVAPSNMPRASHRAFACRLSIRCSASSACTHAAVEGYTLKFVLRLVVLEPAMSGLWHHALGSRPRPWPALRAPMLWPPALWHAGRMRRDATNCL